MSVSVEDVSSPLSEGQSSIFVVNNDCAEGKNESVNAVEEGQEKSEKSENSEPSTPKPHPMAFTIDFGESKQVDNRRLEELAKKSQARHQRVSTMSAGQSKPSPIQSQRPPLSAKLPRKAQGYNSEGYFSSDQEDSGVSVKLRSSPLAQSVDRSNFTSPIATQRQIKSPDVLSNRTSKSPIVDSIMSRSDYTPRQALNLPLKSTSSYIQNVHRTPSYSNLNCHRHVMADIIDQSPEGIMLTDISSPELDILTPDNGLSTPELSKSPLRKSRASETPDLLFKKCPPKSEPLYIDDEDNESNHSSTGTYTIECDNYTEEQKARMSIDRALGVDLYNESVEDTLKKRCSIEKEPDLIFEYPNTQQVITKEPRRDICLRNPIMINKTADLQKVSKDKNVLEISCCYESPNESDLALQTTKQIKSTRSYLEKIKNRVRTITEKTFSKPHDENVDLGTFTSVTTSGVLSSKFPFKIEMPSRRRCSLTKSDIDQTDYVHRLSRESSVPVASDYVHRLSRESSVPVSLLGKGVEDVKFESTALKNAQKALITNTEVSPDHVVGKLSYLSLNRCKGDKTWIQDWADSVKKYNNNSLVKETDLNSTFSVEDRPPISPRLIPTKPRSPHGTPTKIPSPVGTLLHRRTPDLIPPQDTESYLLKTQNAITNLQAKLHSTRTTNITNISNNITNNMSNNLTNIPNALTTSLLSEKTLVSRLPLSQLSRSNSLNYRLRRKDTSNDNSPLRSPGHYVITGSTRTPETKVLLNAASKSLDKDTKYTNTRHDSNMNSPNSEKGLLSNSSDDKTLSNRPQYDVEAILSPHRKTHARHKSFERNDMNLNKTIQPVCLKTVLKNNALEAKTYRIDPIRYQGDVKNLTKLHQRVYSDKTKYNPPAFGSSIKRSSSFNTVNRNNNVEPRFVSRRSSGQSEEYKDSDESDNGSFEKSQDIRFKRLNRGRIEYTDKSVVPSNSPRCPNTPEMQRKFGPGLVRNSVRITSKERGSITRMSEPPASKEERNKPASHQSRRISEPTRQAVLNRLTKSRSSTREVHPKHQEKGQKKPSQHRSSSALASKELEFSNWKKRSSYDPMKAAQEGKKRQQMARRQECNKDDLSSPSHSSPVHRSQSFHTTNIADLTLDYSSEETEDDQLTSTLPVDPMITSTHSDILDLRRDMRRQGQDVVLSRDYVANFQVNQAPDKIKRKNITNRKQYEETTPTKENHIDKRKTYVLDSDTNSTTNGSSPRNSSIFSHEKNSLNTSDTEDSGPESAPVVMRHGKRAPVQPKQRYSGDYSMSSSTTSISKKPKEIQPRYLDISKYKSENSPKNFLRRDPSKTYVGVLGSCDKKEVVSRGSAQHYEMEQKKQELEKWKRRASYDPRKAAAQGKTKPAPKTASNVLRSQSFHGQVLSPNQRYQPPTLITETYDASSDNDF
ncbi:uncharacterized protein [Maniola hyperantus]|uniref:uncharacterized protein n=1 Tax=Aphantopus hyperantus TaxID=2795564 RepID=UPI001569BF61|nr:uncharacterized protein LOC117994011 [Maniola hyperantus]